MNKILLIVDLQKEFADSLNNSNEYNKVVKYVKNNSNSYDKIISTIFRCNNLNYDINLDWSECTDTTVDSLEYYPTKNPCHDILFKGGYGDRENRIVNIIREYNTCASKNAEIHIIGCDLDACIMAICFQLWDAEINFKVLTEYCFTTSTSFTKKDVIKLMKRNFGKCIVE